MTQRPDDPRRAGRRPPFDPMDAVPPEWRGYREATPQERLAEMKAGRTGLVGFQDGVPCYREGTPRARGERRVGGPLVMRYADTGRFIVPLTRG
jgi:hypothetical protein